MVISAPALVNGVYQVGVVTADLERTMESYSSMFGLRGWKRLDTDYEGRFRNWTGKIANRNAFAPWGEVHLEIIEPGIGQSTAREWLDTRGEGIFHLGIAIDDVRQRPFDAEVVFEVTSRLQPDGSPAIVHLDTVERLGFFVELTWRPMAEALCRWVEETSSTAPPA